MIRLASCIHQKHKKFQLLKKDFEELDMCKCQMAHFYCFCVSATTKILRAHSLELVYDYACAQITWNCLRNKQYYLSFSLAEQAHQQFKAYIIPLNECTPPPQIFSYHDDSSSAPETTDL